MEDNRTYDLALVRIEHGQHDDEFQLTNVTRDEAIDAAREHIVQTWEDNLEENAPSLGFPYYGATIELSMLSSPQSLTIQTSARDLDWRDGEIFGNWNIDDGGMLSYSITR